MLVDLRLQIIYNQNFHGQLKINYPRLDYRKWQDISYKESNNSIREILHNLLVKLDCTIEYTSGRPMMTTYPIYEQYVNEYYYWLCKVTNVISYNTWLEMLLKRHIDNLIFEYENPKKLPVKGKSSKKLGWVKQITRDLFTGEERYIYQNLDNGDYINSEDPNLLIILNEKQKKKGCVKNNKKSISQTNKPRYKMGNSQKDILDGEEYGISDKDINEIATFKF